MRLTFLLYFIFFVLNVNAQTTQLQPTSCDLDEIRFIDYLSAVPVNGGIQYRFKIVNESYGTIDSIVKLGYAFNLADFNLSQTESVICRYNSDLLISVAVDLGQGFGAYGESCSIRTIFPLFKPETLGRTVISSAGSTMESNQAPNSYILTYTFGEPKTITKKALVSTSNTFFLNEGFQQPDQWIVMPSENQQLKTSFNLEVYPNPFSGNIIIDSKSNKEKQINLNIYASDGRWIKSCMIEKNIQELNLNNLSSGKYIFEFVNKSSNLNLKKTVIKSF